jgi:hypothetical protein
MKLFDGVPDPVRIAADAGISPSSAEALVLELAWITKTITRLGKGYLLGGHGFCRPDSAADLELNAVELSELKIELPWDSRWVPGEELAVTLDERTGCGGDVGDAVIKSVTAQIDAHPGIGMKVQKRFLELEKVVEDQLMADPSVLAIWGWGLTDVQRQVTLDDGSRADIVGRRGDGTWVVVELKRGAALAATADQVLRYMPLVQQQFANGGPVEGLVIADGADQEFHDRVLGVPETITYLPTRCLNLPACRPQAHRIYDDREIEAGVITVAADGLTVVAALPSPEAFGILEPAELWLAGRRLLDANSVPVPLGPEI